MIPAVARPRAAASIAFRASAEGHANTTSVSCAIPASAKAADIAVLFIDYSIIGGISINSGPNLSWTQIGTEQQDATEIGSRVYWRKLTGGDPGTTITIGFTATSKCNLTIAVWSGVDGTSPIPIFAQASEPGTTTDHVTPTVVNTVTNGWLVSYLNDKSATATALWSAPSSSITRQTSFTTGAGAFTSTVGDSNGPVTALGATQGGLVWSSDQSSAKATMWSLILQPGVSVSNPNQGKMVGGGYNNCVTTGSDGWNGSSYPGDTSAHFKEIRDAYMDPSLWNVRRSFSSSIVANISATSATNDIANGITTFLSVKGDPVGVAAGTYDASIGTLAASMAAGTYLTYYHEPENDMSGATFVAAFQHFYTTAKASNANVLIGPSHLGYQWRSDKTSTSNQASWYVGDAFCDYLACDAYIFDWQATVAAGIGSATDSGFPRWHAFMSTKGKPLILTELGFQVDSADPNHLGRQFDSDRVNMLANSLSYLRANGYVMVLYWNGYHSDANVHDTEITPTLSKTAGHPSVLSAWNTFMASNGSTSTDIRDVV